MVTMLKTKCSVWKRIKFPTFWYNLLFYMVRYLFYTIGDLTYQSPLVHCISMLSRKKPPWAPCLPWWHDEYTVQSVLTCFPHFFFFWKTRRRCYDDCKWEISLSYVPACCTAPCDTFKALCLVIRLQQLLRTACVLQRGPPTATFWVLANNTRTFPTYTTIAKHVVTPVIRTEYVLCRGPRNVYRSSSCVPLRSLSMWSFSYGLENEC